MSNPRTVELRSFKPVGGEYADHNNPITSTAKTGSPDDSKDEHELRVVTARKTLRLCGHHTLQFLQTGIS